MSEELGNKLTEQQKPHICRVVFQRKIAVGDVEERERLTDLYLRHVLPLPQRMRPSSASSVTKKKPDPSPAPVTTDRPKPPVSSINLTNSIYKLSGTSTNSSSNKTLVSSPGAGPKSPCNHSKTANSSTHSNNTPSKLKRTSPSDGEPHTSDIKSPETKKKIQHIPWPSRMDGKRH